VDRLTQLVRTAHADAWEVQGRLREAYGGGAGGVRGARMMASGIAQARWNNADVTGADVDLDAVQAWYEPRAVPWGLRVPLEWDVELGSPLFVKRCVAFLPGNLPEAETDVRVRLAEDAEAFALLDHTAFGGDLADARAWVGPEFASRDVRHWTAERKGDVAGIATTVQSNGEAGRAAYLTGVGVLAGANQPEVLAALVAAAGADAFEAGAALVHANPDAEGLAELGGVEVPGFLVRVVA
jgi:hypothetical protein